MNKLTAALNKKEKNLFFILAKADGETLYAKQNIAPQDEREIIKMYQESVTTGMYIVADLVPAKNVNRAMLKFNLIKHLNEPLIAICLVNSILLTSYPNIPLNFSLATLCIIGFAYRKVKLSKFKSKTLKNIVIQHATI